MPIYEYQCRSCSLKFEVHRRFEEHSGASCPKCHSEARRVISPVPIVFKGSGFYVTDKEGHKAEEQK
jgi:putative FmdB family regulatory protein